MAKIEWLQIANNDLIQIYNYIYQDSVHYAIKTIKEIIITTNNLENFKYMGRKIPEFNKEYRRELIYKSYRIMYSIEPNKILIHRVWHSARKLLQKIIF